MKEFFNPLETWDNKEVYRGYLDELNNKIIKDRSLIRKGTPFKEIKEDMWEEMNKVTTKIKKDMVSYVEGLPNTLDELYKSGFDYVQLYHTIFRHTWNILRSNSHTKESQEKVEGWLVQLDKILSKKDSEENPILYKEYLKIVGEEDWMSFKLHELVRYSSRLKYDNDKAKEKISEIKEEK